MLYINRLRHFRNALLGERITFLCLNGNRLPPRPIPIRSEEEEGAAAVGVGDRLEKLLDYIGSLNEMIKNTPSGADSPEGEET